jgi:hypothetical protein
MDVDSGLAQGCVASYEVMMDGKKGLDEWMN